MRTVADIRIPFQEAETEFTEKRSRFIGRLWRVESEEEARARIAEIRKREYDARHNCWCWLLRDGAARYSDDGEPQGTAGQPILNVFQRQGVTDVCCVVTRYFGGVLLGAGGLTRAYSRSAADTLRAAGICRLTRWSLWEVPCPYPLQARVRQELEALGGMVRSADYGADVVFHAAFPEAAAARFSDRLRELSAGRLKMKPVGEELLPGPRLDAE